MVISGGWIFELPGFVWVAAGVGFMPNVGFGWVMGLVCVLGLVWLDCL